MSEFMVYDNNLSRFDFLVKVDVQIIGITLANEIGKLYTTDIDIIEIVDKLSLPIDSVDFERDEFLSMPLFDKSED